MGRVKDEGFEARQTLIAQTEYANRHAQYVDELERKRHAAYLAVQRNAREAELRLIENSTQRQEDLRRSTLRYQAELRSRSERKLAEAQARAKAQSERENHDLSLECLREDMKERRKTLLQSISVGCSSIGGGMKMFLENQRQMGSAVALTSFLALGIYGARISAAVAGNYLASRLAKPPLVRETSRTTLSSMLGQPSAIQYFTKSHAEFGIMDRLILKESLDHNLHHVALSAKHAKINGAPFRHVLLHGPPGTGKTMFAKQLAARSGLDYAILTGGDISPLGRDAVTEIHRLFSWARRSNRGLLLFIDEADAFLRDRASENLSEDLRNAVNAFLYCTGESSYDFMLVYASNAPEEFDWAINDRIDEIIQFNLPTENERKRMLVQYMDEHMHLIGTNINYDTLLKKTAAATEGFSGREIHKLVIAWQAAALGPSSVEFKPNTMQEILDAHVCQRSLKDSWKPT